MPNYTKQGKMLNPISPEEFEDAFAKLKPKYQAYAVFIYYTGVRVTEALRLYPTAFTFETPAHLILYVEIGKRLKHGKRTAPLPLDLTQPHMKALAEHLIGLRYDQKVFAFSRQTAWRQINKAGLGYNHRARLSLVTAFLQAGYSTVHIVNWFGISVQTVNSYIGNIEMKEMATIKRLGESLGKEMGAIRR